MLDWNPQLGATSEDVLESQLHDPTAVASRQVTVQNAFDIHQHMEDGLLDVAITYLDQYVRAYRRSRVLYTEEYELLIRRGTRFSGKRTISWQDLGDLPLCLLTQDMPIFGAEESEALSEALRKTPHITTTAVWMVMDHVRTGHWATVLPRPVRIMIAQDKELGAIQLPRIGKPSSIGIAIPQHGSFSPVAETFSKSRLRVPSLKSCRSYWGLMQTCRNLRQHAGRLRRARSGVGPPSRIQSGTRSVRPDSGVRYPFLSTFLPEKWLG